MFSAPLYASVVKDLVRAGTPDVSEKLIAYMKVRGHLSLLPQVVRILEREGVSEASGEVVVAREKDLERYRADIAQALEAIKATDHRVRIDAGAVGGYRVRNKTHMVDATLRSALVRIYHNVIS